MEGWIKLHRKFLKWEWFDISEMVQLFIYLLLSANHEKQNWRGETIERGQLLTGRKKISSDLKISEQKIRTCLSKLEKTGEITSKSTNKYSIITLCNYDTYQSTVPEINQQPNQQSTSNQPTTNQQLTTNKNNKKEKNVKNVKKCLFKNSKLTISDIEKAFEETDDIFNADVKYYFNAALDWSSGNNQMRVDWIATIRNFARRDLKDGKLVMKKSNKQIQQW